MASGVVADVMYALAQTLAGVWLAGERLGSGPAPWWWGSVRELPIIVMSRTRPEHERVSQLSEDAALISMAAARALT